ncbi:MAG: DUF6502 family protein [Gammaproteobacteria bacterium]|nr:DUF6502 family protein [Gammaproteobacteria bacterium]MDH4255383.1 DUF6502 family protein [Gammaproteobacteria bacterium]MDH5261372.1 DUF6502 family protein [Gammaproteobacteria bacterium]
MKDEIRDQVLRALLLALKPIARALLHAGIGHREFNEISKCAFVDTATSDYGLRGRPTNISRVAVMTGLTRKEVRRIRNQLETGQSEVIVRTTPLGEILHRWYTDSDYLDQRGNPLDLDFDGAERSFSALVRRFGGDVPPGAMRTELKRIRAITETEDGRLKVLKRNVSGLDVHDRLVFGLAKMIYPSAATLAHNTAPDRAESWPHRSVATKYVREQDLVRLRRISSDRIKAFSESIDDLFVAYESLYEKEGSQTPTHAVGIGVFYFEEDKKDTDIFA